MLNLLKKTAIAVIVIAALCFLIFGAYTISVYIGAPWWLLTVPMALVIGWIIYVMCKLAQWDAEDRRNW
ncbi:hypothetical protein DYU05_04045 [Mucilaginibacter terrenus]|uniref:Uncharacterized protein n=1 Tax=Mucilaginibacter terrenus TaxID=2482727 RepID=A0A3E2NV08_9SPHI|nr:hypothetical protein [Mucilaginibacter terrenus]RFZ84787.1 hypothetical protein DYU05_04045 [Mucilaginibacter terrenus]